MSTSRQDNNRPGRDGDALQRQARAGSEGSGPAFHSVSRRDGSKQSLQRVDPELQKSASEEARRMQASIMRANGFQCSPLATASRHPMLECALTLRSECRSG